ncbi:MAG: hypothetical protein R3290_07540 [Acidimicrobiia bacterium]|nr:hypothetical protein [Acidimicrobiia bacterium]
MDTQTAPPAQRVAGGIRRLGVVQALVSAGEACLAVSLAGSLFFGVSLDAARPVILLYLCLTMAPFAVVVPVIGPVVDRVRGGQRAVIVSGLALRVVVFLLLAVHLERLAFYPEAFAALVLGKVFVVSRSAIVPRLEPRPGLLVRANSIVSVVGALGLAVGGAVAAGVLAVAGASWVLRMGAGLMAAALVVALTLPPTRSIVTRRRRALLDVRTPVLRDGIAAIGALRLLVGFVTFHLAFVLRAAGVPLWQFGAVLGAAAAGGLVGSLTAPMLRRLTGESSLIGIALALPALAAVPGALRFDVITGGVLAAALGLAATLGKHGFDSLVQRQAVEADLGRAFARLETTFQVAWVVGALVAVLVRAPAWAGSAGVAVIGGYAFAAYVFDLRITSKRATERDGVAESLFVAARLRAMRGARREAIVLAATAAAAAVDAGRPEAAGWDGSELERLRIAALTDLEPPDGDDVDRALDLAAAVADPSGV